MKSSVLFLALLYLATACQDPSSDSQKTTQLLTGVESESSQKYAMTIPKGYSLLAETWGDLNKDGIEEWVRIYNTDREGDFGVERELYIYEKNYVNESYELLHLAKGAVLPDAHGGMMGDPFGEVMVENGAIVIRQQGGSRYKWFYVHRFRLQAEQWQLIGATIESGAPCDMWENFDYNLSTGKVAYNMDHEICENDSVTSIEIQETFFHKLENLPQMDGFYPGDNEVSLNDTLSFYF